MDWLPPLRALAARMVLDLLGVVILVAVGVALDIDPDKPAASASLLLAAVTYGALVEASMPTPTRRGTRR